LSIHRADTSKLNDDTEIHRNLSLIDSFHIWS
jgi:hypothetical protein